LLFNVMILFDNFFVGKVVIIHVCFLESVDLISLF
jgi:hypothetical protein